MSEKPDLCVVSRETGHIQRDATETDLAAAGYVPASRLADVTAKLMNYVPRAKLEESERRLAAANTRITELGLMRNEDTSRLQNVSTKLAAAEGRVRELEREIAEHWMTEEELVARYGGSPVVVTPEEVYSALRSDVPEAAKPAERAPVEGCGCDGCTYCKDNHDADTRCLCRCQFHDKPASPPSPAFTYQDWLKQGEEAERLAARAVAASSPPSPAQAYPVLTGRCAYTIGVRRCNRELGHEGAHVCPHPDQEHLIHQQPAQADPVPTLAEELSEGAEALFDMLHLYRGYNVLSRGPIGCIHKALRVLHPEAQAMLAGGAEVDDVRQRFWPTDENGDPLEPTDPQPPAAPGTPLTVEALERTLAAADKLAGAGCYDNARVCIDLIRQALADELERAQKGGGK